MKIDKNESYSAWTLNEEFQQKKLYDPRPEVPHSCCIRDDTGKYLDEKKCLTTKPSKATVYTTVRMFSGGAVIRLRGQAKEESCFLILSLHRTA